MNVNSTSIKSIIKVLLGCFLFGIILVRADIRNLIIILSDVNYKYFVAGIFCFLISMGFESLKLYSLLFRVSNSLLDSVRLTLVGLFFNNFLPSNVGGDSYKVFLLGKNGDWLRAAMTVFVDRGLGLLVLISGSFILMMDFSLKFVPWKNYLIKIESFFSAWMIAVVFSLFVAMLIVFVKCQNSIFRRFIVFCQNCLRIVKDISLTQYIAAIISAFFFHSSRVVGILLFIVSLGLSATFGEVWFLLAFVAIVSMIPLSIGALGIREGAIVFGLGMFGIGVTEATAIAVMARLVLWLQALAGGLVFIFYRQK